MRCSREPGIGQHLEVPVFGACSRAYQRYDLRPISQTPCSERHDQIRLRLSTSLGNFQHLAPERMRRHALPKTNGFVTKRLLKLLDMIGILAQRSRGDNVDARGFERVVDVLSAGFREGKAVRYVWVLCAWEGEAVGLAF